MIPAGVRLVSGPRYREVSLYGHHVLLL